MLYNIILIIHIINCSDKSLITSRSQLANHIYAYMDSLVLSIATSCTAPEGQACAEHLYHRRIWHSHGFEVLEELFSIIKLLSTKIIGFTRMCT